MCAGKAGVGFNRWSQVISAVVSEPAVPIGGREGRARVRDLKARENDSVAGRVGLEMRNY